MFVIVCCVCVFVCVFRLLQEKLDQPVSAPPSPRDINNGDTARNLVQHIENLRGEVAGLKSQLRAAQIERELTACLEIWAETE